MIEFLKWRIGSLVQSMNSRFYIHRLPIYCPQSILDLKSATGEAASAGLEVKPKIAWTRTLRESVAHTFLSFLPRCWSLYTGDTNHVNGSFWSLEPKNDLLTFQENSDQHLHITWCWCIARCRVRSKPYRCLIRVVMRDLPHFKFTPRQALEGVWIPLFWFHACEGTSNYVQIW